MYVNEYMGERENHYLKGELLVVCSGYALINKDDTGTNRPNGLPDYQIVYVESGICYLHNNSEVLKIKKNQLIFFHPGEPQVYRYDKNDCSKIYWLHFTGDKVEELLKNLNLYNKKIININDATAIQKSINKITLELRDKKTGYEISIASLLLDLLVKISRNRKIRSIEQVKTINMICKYIEENFNTPKTNSDYARQCNLSNSYFLTLFKKQTGTTPQQYKLNCQINAAQSLLITTDYNIKYISEYVGFENALYFSRYFKNRTGYSPREFRKKYIIK